MAAYLKRLVSSLAAYQLADVVSKFIAVLLLPVYTRFVTPAGYGVVELLANGVIFVSIVIRFGMIEAFLRYYFTDSDQQRRDALARRAVLFLLIATTLASIVMALAAGPLSQIVLGYRDVEHAVEMANDTEYGLCASVWSNDEALTSSVAARLEAGTIFVNAHGMSAMDPGAPMGGWKSSGFGVELGPEGMQAFTRPQVVLHHPAPGTVP